MTETKSPVAGYVPNVALSIVGLSAFALLASIFWLRFALQGRHRYMLVLCISTTTMAAGYGIRIPLSSDPFSIPTYALSTLVTLLSPCGFLAMDYILLPRLATFLAAEDMLPVRTTWIVRIFLTSDITTFLFQAIGGGLEAVSGETVNKIGHWVSLVSLSVQCASFSLFTFLGAVFGYRMFNRPLAKLRAPDFGRGMTVYYSLMWSTIGILMRCIFRVAEYAPGRNGYLATHEAYFYGLDSLPLFLAMISWAVFWPPKYLDRWERRSDTRSSTPMTHIPDPIVSGDQVEKR